MAVHVAEAADIHEDVEPESCSGVESAKRLVVLAALPQPDFDNFQNRGVGETGQKVADLAVGVVAGGVEERGGELDFEGFGAFDELHKRGIVNGHVAKKIGSSLGKVGLGFDQVFVRLGVFDQRGSGADLTDKKLGGFCGESGRGVAVERGKFIDESLGRPGVEVPCGTGGGVTQLCAQVPNLGGGMGEQARDLSFEGAGAHDLAERGIGCQRQQIAGDVEGAGAESALVSLQLQGFGARNAAAEQVEDSGADMLVGIEEAFYGFGVELGRFGIFSEIREIPAGPEEVLVAGGTLLAVPAGLVDEGNGSQQTESLDGEGDVSQVGDGAMAILKIKGVEELLGALGTDFVERLAHGKRGAGVFGHGKGEDFGVGAVDGYYFGLVLSIGWNERFTGHEDGLADRIRHEGVAARGPALGAG